MGSEVRILERGWLLIKQGGRKAVQEQRLKSLNVSKIALKEKFPAGGVTEFYVPKTIWERKIVTDVVSFWWRLPVVGWNPQCSFLRHRTVLACSRMIPQKQQPWLDLDGF